MKEKPPPTGRAKSPTPGAAIPLDQRTWLALLLLMTATMALYWPVLHGEYIQLDDFQYAAQNPMVQKGLTWPGIIWAFTTTVVSNWHPLTMISLMLDCSLLGNGPWGHHLGNLVLHALDTGLVYLFLRQITGAYWRSLFVAAWFGWHPLHVESVAWIAERKDVLSTFFWLLALWCYGFYAQGIRTTALKPRHFYILTLIFMTLGLMCKAMLVTIPCVLLLLDYWPLNRLRPGRLKPFLLEKIPFFILAAVISVVTFIVQRQTGGLATTTIFPLEIRTGNALFSYCRYLFKTFWPSDLAIFYPYPISGRWPWEYVTISLLVLGAISGWAWVTRKNSPFLLTGWLWFLGTLVPVIGVIQVGNQAMADRYTYVPLIGVFIMVAWGGSALAGTLRVPRSPLLAVGLATSLLCLAATHQELGYWRNTLTLFERALAVTQDNFVAYRTFGDIYLAQGDNERAIANYKEAVRISPRSVGPHVNLGVAYLRLNRLNDAIGQFQEGVGLQPGNAKIHLDLGYELLQKGMADDAIAELQTTLQLDPTDTDAPAMLAQAKELKVNPPTMKEIQATNDEAWSLATNPDPAKRDGATAVAFAASACQQTQYKIPAFVGTLAAAYAEAGQFDTAVAMAQQACDLATQTGETNEVSRNRELIKLYQSHQAYHGQ